MAIVNLNNTPAKNYQAPSQNNNEVNNSGQGSNAPVADCISKKFNWGAFLLNWIWGLGNKSFITLIILPISFIPFIGGFVALACNIWFGIKGNEWAWQNKTWDDVESFHATQEKWAIAGVILAILGIILTVLCFVVYGSLFTYKAGLYQ